MDGLGEEAFLAAGSGDLVEGKSETSKKSIEVTNSNLGAHLAKLVEAGYVKEQKRFEGQRPQTRYQLTKTGRTAFLRHVAALQALVDAHM